MEIVQLEEQRKRMKKNEQSLKGNMDTGTCTNLQVIGVPGGEESEKAEKRFKELAGVVVHAYNPSNSGGTQFEASPGTKVPEASSQSIMVVCTCHSSSIESVNRWVVVQASPGMNSRPYS
jgi:hypothetical protein